MFDFYTVLYILGSSVLGFFIGILLMRLYGRLVVSAMLKSMSSNLNKKQSLFKFEFDDSNISVSFNIPKLIDNIKKVFYTEQNNGVKEIKKGEEYELEKTDEKTKKL